MSVEHPSATECWFCCQEIEDIQDEVHVQIESKGEVKDVIICRECAGTEEETWKQEWQIPTKVHDV